MTIDEKDLEIARLRGQVEALERIVAAYQAMTAVPMIPVIDPFHQPTVDSFPQQPTLPIEPCLPNPNLAQSVERSWGPSVFDIAECKPITVDDVLATRDRMLAGLKSGS